MSTKAIPAARSKAIRAAWRNTRSAWRHTESSVGALMRANKRLFLNLGKAGAVAAGRARREFESAVKSLESSGRLAKQKLEQFAREHAPPTPVRARVASKPAARARKRSAIR